MARGRAGAATSVARSVGNSHGVGGQNQIAEGGGVTHSPKGRLVARERHEKLTTVGKKNSEAAGALVETLDLAAVDLGDARVRVGEKDPNLAKLE